MTRGTEDRSGRLRPGRWIAMVMGLPIAVLFLLAAINVVLASYLTYGRADLGIGTPEEERCRKAAVANVWRWERSPTGPGKGFPDYNAEIVADYFGVYAAYSHNSYPLPEARRFRLDPEEFGWTPVRSISRFGGFHADVYQRDRGDRLSVLVAFRGTQFELSWDALWDWISNAGYLTQALNPWDQYGTAREVFGAIRREARKAAGNRIIDYIAVGHSLGGGIARHIAEAFPCMTAITFNASFVTNRFRLEEPYCDARLISLWEDEDLLSRIGQHIAPRDFYRLNENRQWYRLSVPEEGFDQHGIRIAAAGLARIAVMCLEDKEGKGCELDSVNYGLDFPEARHRDRAEIMKLYCVATPAISEGAKADKRDLCGTRPM